jgi:amino acid transporter
VSGISILYAGVFAPLVLLIIGAVLYVYKAVYTEVVEALPTNGGAYNCLLNATAKNIAAIAGATTILSYIATAVISGESAIQYLNTILLIPIIPVTIALLAAFAVLVVSGIRDSARVAFAIFSLHVAVLTGFILMGARYALAHEHSYLYENMTATMPLVSRIGGLVPALFFGFAASLLGVSGFESSANFVEEQQHGVFRKTLRNMLIGVVIFNPLIALIALNVMPFAQIIADKNFLLSNAAHILGGTWFMYVVAIDAVLVLAGAVLTAFVGVSGLVCRMTTDGCFPNILAKRNAKGSYPLIVGAFFALCVSILLLTRGDLLSLAGVYAIAFLSVMTFFAGGNLIMRATRRDLKRTYSAPLIFVIVAFFSTLAGVAGNIRLNASNFDYFVLYFVPAACIVYATLNLESILVFLVRFTARLKPLHTYFQHQLHALSSDTFVVFVRHLDRLSDILDYIHRNEAGKRIYLVHCGNARSETDYVAYRELQQALPILQSTGALRHLHVHTLFRPTAFGPDTVNDVARELNIPKNKILIGSIHHEHPFDYEDFGGVRIIF